MAGRAPLDPLASLQLDVPISGIESLFDAAFEVEGCFLLTRAQLVRALHELAAERLVA